jgi:hypothetical protein
MDKTVVEHYECIDCRKLFFVDDKENIFLQTSKNNSYTEEDGR